MPTLLVKNGYRFFFWSNERMKPAHIHIKKDDGYAKLWLSPVELAKATNFAAHELNEIIKITMEYSDYFREKWNEYFSNKI